MNYDFDTARVRVVAFDLFGTVFDLKSAPAEEVRDYGRQIRLPEWQPLVLPRTWETMPAFPDSAEGLRLLRERFFVSSLSNAPLGLAAKMCKNAGVHFDCLLPLELGRVYKPNPLAYLKLCDVLACMPSEVLIVTANKDFGDIEAARSLGMQATLIRHPAAAFPTIVALAQALSGGV